MAQAKLPLGATYDAALDAARMSGVDAVVLAQLLGGAWVGRSALLQATGNAAINSSIARLRKRGHVIHARRAPGREQSGAWEYQLKQKEQ